MYLFDRAFIAVRCPRRTYEVDIQLRLAQLEDIAFCPCCKVEIQFTDDSVSGHRARRSAHNALSGLKRQLEDLNRTLSIDI